MMLTSLLLMSATIVGSACEPNGPAIVHVGNYENWRNTEEHQYGLSVQLWKQGEKLFGLLRVAEGHLAGDIPIGILENIAVDSGTGKVSFRSKLSLGLIAANDYSRDLYSFSGTMQSGRIEGSIERQDGSGRSFGSREVALVRDAEADETPGPGSCSDWIKLWEPVFQAWGPKW